jgi:hypothetical protein
MIWGWKLGIDKEWMLNHYPSVPLSFDWHSMDVIDAGV